MNFDLNEDQLAFQDAARAFAQTELLPYAAHWDEEHIFPEAALRKAAEQGFAAIYVRDDVGGEMIVHLAFYAGFANAFGATARLGTCSPILQYVVTCIRHNITIDGPGSAASATPTAI